MATAVTQFYKAYLAYGNTVIPTLPGARLTAPMNWDVPPIIGNYWQLNYGDGLIMPVVDVQLAVLDSATPTIFAATSAITADPTGFFDLFTNRSTDAAHDTSHTSNLYTDGVVFWDGVSGFKLTGAKADSFMIGCSKGDSIRMSCRFVGNGITPLDSGEMATTLSGWSGYLSGKTLRFNSVILDGGSGLLSNNVWRFDLSFSNNHTPNLSLDGTQYPTAMNAGMQTVGFNLMNQAGDITAISGSHTIQIGTTAGSVNYAQAVFTLNNLLDNTPMERQIEQPRVMRRHTFTCLGGDAQSTPPLSIACTVAG